MYDLRTSLQAHLYLLNNEELIKKGWSGQFPPKHFASTPKGKSKDKDIVQSKLASSVKTVIGTKIEK
jgi:hypothetical protein